MPRVIEAMTRVELVDGRTVRVWSEIERLDRFCDETQRIAGLVCSLAVGGTRTQLLAAVIAQNPGVNAVEVLESDGCGLLIYPDWP